MIRASSSSTNRRLRALAGLAAARAPEDLGEHFGSGLYAREVDYFVAREWAVTAEDVLWRRTKLGLHFSAAQRTAVAAWCEARDEFRHFRIDRILGTSMAVLRRCVMYEYHPIGRELP